MIATLVLVLRLGLAAALYTFLGWALWTLLQELRQQGERLAARRKPAISVHIKMEHGQENVRRFTQAEIMIGRDPGCDLSMMDGALSARHARLAHHHGQWWLEDLNSTNGTRLNREKLTTPAVVITGDEFECGNTLFAIQVEDNANSPAAEVS